MTESGATSPGRIRLRPEPVGLPDPSIQPPTVAESGDPFAALRIVHLLARLERGTPVLLTDLADALNAAWLDWLFTPTVVADAILQLQANWMTDYRNASGIVIEDGPYGTAVTLEDSTRVDPWLVRQAGRLAAECRERLRIFARSDRATGEG